MLILMLLILMLSMNVGQVNVT